MLLLATCIILCSWFIETLARHNLLVVTESANTATPATDPPTLVIPALDMQCSKQPAEPQLTTCTYKRL
jgi:hypothetical protein